MTARNKNIPALRFKGFDAMWSSCTLGDVTKYTKGFAFKSSDYSDTGNRIIRVSDLGVDSIKSDNDKLYISPDRVAEYTKYLLEPGNIIITTVGSKPDLLESAVGRGIFVKRENEGLLNQNLLKFENIHGVDNGFIYGLINSKKYQLHIKGIARGNANQANITVVDLLQFKIFIPSLQEQQKIASFLSAIDEKIHQLTRRKELLEQYKKGVMQQLFSGKLRFKDEKGMAYPKWEEKKLGEVCECLDNIRKPLNDSQRQTMQGTIPYWGANNIMDYINDFLFDETIVLLAEDGGNFNEYKTRPIANLSRGKCWVNNHTHVLKGKKGLINEFLFYSLVHKNITGYVSGGTRAKLTKGQMLKINIGFPSLIEQQKIASFLSSIDAKIESVNAQIEGTKGYKKGLLQQMFV